MAGYSSIVPKILTLAHGTHQDAPFTVLEHLEHCSGTNEQYEMVLECTRCLEQCLVHYICVQPCITIFISYLHNQLYNDLLVFCIFKYAFVMFLLVDFAQPWCSNSV